MIVNRQFYTMKDGVNLSAIEVLNSEAPKFVVLHLHANSYTNFIYTGYGKSLSEQGGFIALLNLRGNGDSEGKKGHVDYIGQLEDDIDQVVLGFKKRFPATPIFLSGHSGGAAICLRYVNKYKKQNISGLILLAPIIQPHSEASRYKVSYSWLTNIFNNKQKNKDRLPDDKKNQLPKIFYIRVFLAKIFPFLRNITTLVFPDMGSDTGGRTYAFSYKTMKNYSIEDYHRTFKELNLPVFMSIGQDDDVTLPQFIDDMGQRYLADKKETEWHLLDKVNHINVVRKSQKMIASWLLAVA